MEVEQNNHSPVSEKRTMPSAVVDPSIKEQSLEEKCVVQEETIVAAEKPLVVENVATPESLPKPIPEVATSEGNLGIETANRNEDEMMEGAAERTSSQTRTDVALSTDMLVLDQTESDVNSVDQSDSVKAVSSLNIETNSIDSMQQQREPVLQSEPEVMSAETEQSNLAEGQSSGDAGRP